MTAAEPQRSGKIVTFYSYKGGTGRSMALANVAWILASRGCRVLAIDWDLEAPGLHRYFEPFLQDPSLERSTGVVDFVRDFATAALSVEPGTQEKDWYREYSNILAHAVSVEWQFPGAGCLNFVPAGRQDVAYPVRVNSFDWQGFYERLGGGVMLEDAKRGLRGLYDFVLIDSRTGVSDTAGVCTVQMPDELVVCFTLNRQSIYGASAAARSVFEQRRTRTGAPTVKIWPLPTRVDPSEKDRLEVAQTIARVRFTGLLSHLDPEEEDKYWDEIPVPYEAYYAYEEVLATFRERSRRPSSMLVGMERIAGYLTGGPSSSPDVIDEAQRSKGLAAFISRAASDVAEELALMGDEYESIRGRMSSGPRRTELMNYVVARTQLLGARGGGAIAEQFFRKGTPGGRIVGLALARGEPHRNQVEMALSGISPMRTPFEQFHALLLAQQLVPLLEASAGAQVYAAVAAEVGKTITELDASRWVVARDLLKALEGTAKRGDRSRPQEMLARTVAGQRVVLVESRPPVSSVRYDDVTEKHGPYVITRGVHQAVLPQILRMGRHLVTNALFGEFVRANGYENQRYWSKRSRIARRCRTADGNSLGPGNWADATTLPEGKDDHPVTNISFAEALAFVCWCDDTCPADPGWRWSLPPEDHWEYAARAESALIYPWGDAFDAARCNSSESGIGGTSHVTRFESDASPLGCCDMAGNVWEFVVATDAEAGQCVLRGGSFKNDRFELRSYLRLVRIQETIRPRDFGFRLAQVEISEAGLGAA
jgi:formylglycine-generating enzyme required for sulfatase activity/cellulose biosynthesis protein BcsQ